MKYLGALCLAIAITMFSGNYAVAVMDISDYRVRNALVEQCWSLDEQELENNMIVHSKAVYRLAAKYEPDPYYWNNWIPDHLRFAALSDVQHYLGNLRDREAGVLFHVDGLGVVCTWLITKDSIRSYRDIRGLGSLSIPRLEDAVTRGLGLEGKAAGKAPKRRGPAFDSPECPDDVPMDRSEGVAERSPAMVISDFLRQGEIVLPVEIRKAIGDEALDTIIVVPRAGTSTLPFAGWLSEFASVFISPGFHSFIPYYRAPFIEPSALTARGATTGPLVVGFGEKAYTRGGWFFPAIPGAVEEAKDVARILGVDLLKGKDATVDRLGREIENRPPGLIYLSTHGAANPNLTPWKTSFLVFKDRFLTPLVIGSWREHLMKSRPLVVMSACQTALGKEYYGGTFSLARAWVHAGASCVVMSLWNVDVEATKFLMVRFMEHVRDEPPDRALRKAMEETRKDYPDPSLWAGFTVFGMPDRSRPYRGPIEVDQ